MDQVVVVEVFDFRKILDDDFRKGLFGLSLVIVPIWSDSRRRGI